MTPTYINPPEFFELNKHKDTDALINEIHELRDVLNRAFSSPDCLAPTPDFFRDSPSAINKWFYGLDPKTLTVAEGSPASQWQINIHKLAAEFPSIDISSALFRKNLLAHVLNLFRSATVLHENGFVVRSNRIPAPDLPPSMMNMQSVIEVDPGITLLRNLAELNAQYAAAAVVVSSEGPPAPTFFSSADDFRAAFGDPTVVTDVTPKSPETPQTDDGLDPLNEDPDAL